MRIKIIVWYRDVDRKSFKRTLRYVNPEASDSTVLQCVHNLNSLTTNTVEEVFKVVDQYLIDDAIYEDDSFVSAQDVQDILSGDYNPASDDDPITEQDLLDILSGDYTPVDNDFSADDFVF